jgi:hypothetical protein
VALGRAPAFSLESAAPLLAGAAGGDDHRECRDGDCDPESLSLEHETYLFPWGTLRVRLLISSAGKCDASIRNGT